MKFLKLLLISFVLLFVLVTTISLFIPSSVRISKAVNVVAKKDSLYQEVADIRRWPLWYPPMQDTAVQTRWEQDGNTVWLNGTKIVIDKRKTDEILASLSTQSGRKVISGWKFMEIQQADSLTVQWYMDFKLKWYPWEKFSSLFYESMYGVQMEKGLQNLKALAEKDHSSLN
ncbi:MAG: hypothetical protein GC171_00205 [Terrimonas sp.]|nr:hypothetical protein [Terrimonas sp.]